MNDYQKELYSRTNISLRSQLGDEIHKQIPLIHMDSVS